MTTPRKPAHAFTLIELLIVVAIIAILAAIAVPNFLEAQTRSKISRSKADMRTVLTAIESYTVDYGNEPAVDRGTTLPYSASGRTDIPPECGQAGGYAYSAWWGFVGTSLTTPVAYLTSRPPMPFFDRTVLQSWRNMGGSQDNQPYTIIRKLSTAAGWPIVQVDPAPADIPPMVRCEEFKREAQRHGYVIYTAGADGLDSTVWGGSATYDPTNGTVSFGDVYTFGGAPKDGLSDGCY